MDRGDVRLEDGEVAGRHGAGRERGGVPGPAGMVLFVVGWLAVPTVSLMISHADLFGLRPAVAVVSGDPSPAARPRAPCSSAARTAMGG